MAFVSLALVGSCGCGGGGSTPSSPSPTATTTPPVITAPAPTPTPTTTPSRDTTPPSFSASFVAGDAIVGFFVFGVRLPSGVLNPTFEVETANQTVPVFAASAGKVVNITTTSQGDRAVFIVPSDTSIFDIAYDHVNNVQVSIGQMIAAGQQIGTVGTLNNGRGRTELQINRNDGTTVAVCPTNFGTAAFNDTYRAVAQRVNGSATVCAADTVVP
jgi:hypothetical protein